MYFGALKTIQTYLSGLRKTPVILSQDYERLWAVTIISCISSLHENPLIHYGPYQLEWRQNKEAGKTLAVLPRRGNGADNATVARQGLYK